MSNGNQKIQKVYVLGSGTLAYECAKYAKEKETDFNTEVYLFEMTKKRSIGLEKKAMAAGIAYQYMERKQVYDLLCAEKAEVLLVSAINEFIIPKRVLERENITAVNLHQALLPVHPGRNAESWAIYEEDEKSGITWHLMQVEVDAGDIICQKEIPLDETITAYQLFQKQIMLSKEAFVEIYESLIYKNAKSYPQEKKDHVRMHKSTEIPNDGYINLEWDGKKIGAFLRAMDYSVLKVLGSPKIVYGKRTYSIGKYQITTTQKEKNKVELVDGEIHIYKDGYDIILKKLKEEM